MDRAGLVELSAELKLVCRLHGGTLRRLRPNTTFKDIAGLEEVKGEVMEVIECLRNPKKFERLRARAPLGVLLTGPPGTGVLQQSLHAVVPKCKP